MSSVLVAEVFRVSFELVSAGCFVVPDGSGRLKLLQNGNLERRTLMIGCA